MESKFEMRERIDKEDSKHELAENLAYKEKEMREKLEEKGMPKENIGEVADEISTIELEKMEMQKEVEKAEEREKKAQEKSLVDKLTGLENRRALEKDGMQILSIEGRNKKDVAVLMLDFDHFKKVNDEFGHMAGDDALKALAKIIKNNIRQGADSAYRFGGEEFLVLLPGATTMEAKSVAEKIRLAIENASISVRDKKGNEIILNKTVSIGISGTDQISDWKKEKHAVKDTKNFFDSLIRMADAALYYSKESGRNQASIYENKK